MKTITDRPGRYFGSFVFSPTLLYCGITVRPHYSNISKTLVLFSSMLFLYEMFWIVYRDNKTRDIIYL